MVVAPLRPAALRRRGGLRTVDPCVLALRTADPRSPCASGAPASCGGALPSRALWLPPPWRLDCGKACHQAASRSNTRRWNQMEPASKAGLGPDSNRGRGRPRHAIEADVPDGAPPPLPTPTPIERRPFDSTALEATIAQLDAVVRQARNALRAITDGTPEGGAGPSPNRAEAAPAEIPGF